MLDLLEHHQTPIGKFGGDTDNWVWPRHTGDFSVFRIYAGKDNKPAEYNSDNKPYNPLHYLPISMKDPGKWRFYNGVWFSGKHRTARLLKLF